MLMNELKPLAAAEFNKYITDEFAREYFIDTFDLWAESESKYSAENNGYKVIIKRHISDIEAAIKQAHIFLKTEYTKRISALNNAYNNELNTKDSAETRTQTDGEFTQTQRQYPTGYIQEPDTAYISAQTIDGEFVQTNNNALIETNERDNTSSNTADTEEADILSIADKLTAYKSSYSLIERCVFNFVANDIIGVF